MTPTNLLKSQDSNGAKIYFFYNKILIIFQFSTKIFSFKYDLSRDVI